MSYSQIIDLIFNILTIIISLMLVHFVVFAIVGVFTHKKFIKADVKRKYGIVISSRNEEAVIGNLIKSIRKNDYPQELLHVFVVAHNCTDRTAEISRNLGATVYEYNNPNECTKGYALRHLFECIDRDYGILSYDGFFFFDADNILSKDYFDKMNDAFEAGKCKNVVTSFRHSKNFGANLLSGLYGLFFVHTCRFELRGRTVCGCSARVYGTGFVVSSEFLKDGWNYVSLVEDWEFSVDWVLRGKKIVYCDEAVFYDEQPTKFRVMLRQRLRWGKGTLIICKNKGNKLLGSLFAHSKRSEDRHDSELSRLSRYDLFCQLPIGVVALVIGILNFLFRLSTVFFADKPVIALRDMAIGLGISTLIGYVVLVLSAALLFILEHKRIKNVGAGKRVAICLLWPLFLLLSPVLMVASIFRKPEWKAIPHSDSTDIDELEKAYGREEAVENEPLADETLLVAATTLNNDDFTPPSEQNEDNTKDNIEG